MSREAEKRQMSTSTEDRQWCRTTCYAFVPFKLQATTSDGLRVCVCACAYRNHPVGNQLFPLFVCPRFYFWVFTHPLTIQGNPKSFPGHQALRTVLRFLNASSPRSSTDANTDCTTPLQMHSSSAGQDIFPSQEGCQSLGRKMAFQCHQAQVAEMDLKSVSPCTWKLFCLTSWLSQILLCRTLLSEHNQSARMTIKFWRLEFCHWFKSTE